MFLGCFLSCLLGIILASTAVFHWVEVIGVVTSTPLRVVPVYFAAITDCSGGVTFWLFWLASTTVYHGVEVSGVVTSAPARVVPVYPTSISVWVDCSGGVTCWLRTWLASTAVFHGIEVSGVVTSTPARVVPVYFAAISVWVDCSGGVTCIFRFWFWYWSYNTYSLVFNLTFFTSYTGPSWVSHVNLDAVFRVWQVSTWTIWCNFISWKTQFTVGI